MPARRGGAAAAKDVAGVDSLTTLEFQFKFDHRQI